MITRSLPRRILPLAALLLLSGVGCAHYQYDMVKPPDLAQRVGTKSPVTFKMEDVAYALQTSNNRLVMMVTNESDVAIKLIGGESYAVDPYGESHPLASRVIPPGAHVKLILPPPSEVMVDNGPHFGIGLGVGVSSAHHHGGHYYGGGMYDDGPRYYSVYDPNDPTFWKWEGESEARLLLTFEREGKHFSDEFVFKRVKV